MAVAAGRTRKSAYAGAGGGASRPVAADDGAAAVQSEPGVGRGLTGKCAGEQEERRRLRLNS